MPLCRPALAALATLEFTFIYNDFFWALILIKDGNRRPITSALNNLQGAVLHRHNLLAAGALLAAIPTILVLPRPVRSSSSAACRWVRQGLAGAALAGHRPAC